MDRYGITLTKYICRVYDGKEVVHEVKFEKNDSIPVRNLYLMFHASQYIVPTFLAKVESGEFASFTGTNAAGARLDTPPEFDRRSHVWVVGK